MSIAEAVQKIKSFLDSPKGHDVLIVIIIIATSISSFILGRTTRTEGSAVVIRTDSSLIVDKSQEQPIIQTAAVLNTQKSSGSPKMANTSGGAFVASSRGKKYYPVDCNAASSLSEANKIYFATAQEAEAKGYSLSSSCN